MLFRNSNPNTVITILNIIVNVKELPIIFSASSLFPSPNFIDTFVVIRVVN